MNTPAARPAMVSPMAPTRVEELVERTGSWLPVRCLRRFQRINGRDRGFVIAGQAFTTVVPLLLVLGAAFGRKGTAGIADRFNARYRLHGTSAEALRTLFERPPGATGTITIASFVILLPSLVALTRSLQRVFEQAWSLPPVGVRGTLHGLTGMGLLLSSVLVLSLLASALRPLPAGTALGVLLRMIGAAAVWLVLIDQLLSRRIALRRLVPGALVAGIGQTAVNVFSGVWMPHLIGQNADRYGVIGVTFAIVSWLIIIGIAVVLLAATGAELAGAPKSPPADG
jgi:membrane protein